jgi:type VI secretion system protein ImpC
VAHDRSEVHLAADLSAPSPREIESSVFRILIAGDFSGRSPGGGPAATPFAKRRPMSVDRDDLDAALARVAPEVRLSLDPNEPPVAIAFSALEDFHPDSLLERVPLLQRLRAFRTEAATATPATSAPPRSSERPQSVALDLSAGSLLDRIVENPGEPVVIPSVSEGSAVAKPGAASRDDLSEFVARAVRSHTVAESTPQQRELAAKIDGVISAMLRVLLHHPCIQSLESLWRGVDFVVRRLDTGDSLEVQIVDVSREELVADLSSDDFGRGVIARLLGGAGTWSLLVAAYDFGPDDVPLLGKLATLGRVAGAPWLAAANARFVGAVSFASDPDDWTVHRPAMWSELRTSASATFLSLAAPRFLLRLPYGRRGEECDTFPFEELGDGAPAHESFLWGNPALACLLGIAGSAASGEPAATRATIDGMPLYVAPIDGEPTAIPCAEVLLPESTVEDLLDAGFTPLVSPRDDDTIIMPRIQSVATPPRPLAIPVSSR